MRVHFTHSPHSNMAGLRSEALLQKRCRPACPVAVQRYVCMDMNLLDQHKQRWQQNRSMFWCNRVYVEMDGHFMLDGRPTNGSSSQQIKHQVRKCESAAASATTSFLRLQHHSHYEQAAPVQPCCVCSTKGYVTSVATVPTQQSLATIKPHKALSMVLCDLCEL